MFLYKSQGISENHYYVNSVLFSTSLLLRYYHPCAIFFVLTCMALGMSTRQAAMKKVHRKKNYERAYILQFFLKFIPTYDRLNHGFFAGKPMNRKVRML